jgi:hypothetical protein
MTQTDSNLAPILHLYQHSQGIKMGSELIQIGASVVACFFLAAVLMAKQ